MTEFGCAGEQCLMSTSVCVTSFELQTGGGQTLLSMFALCCNCIDEIPNIKVFHQITENGRVFTRATLCFTGRMPFLQPPNQQRQSTEGNYYKSKLSREYERD